MHLHLAVAKGHDSEMATITNDLDLGSTLYEVVCQYADLGNHRTGSEVDGATVRWLEAELAFRGAVVEHIEYNFPRYCVTSEVLIGGHTVEALPLYYEAVGNVSTAHPFVASLNVDVARHPVKGDLTITPDLGRTISAAKAAGSAAALFATQGADGRLIVFNRPGRAGSGLPVLLVPGALSEELQREPLQVDVAASNCAGTSANVLGYFGDAERHNPLVITTPLTGWFRCAGERGTGIAVALEVATRLAADFPVLFVGTSGHEIGYLGVKDFIRGHRHLRPRGVVFVGASVGSGAPDEDGNLKLTPRRVITTASLSGFGPLTPMLESANLSLRQDDDARSWAGEICEWTGYGVPLLSVRGRSPLFHTPDDLPQQSTSPQLMELASDSLVEVIRLFAQNGVIP